MPYSVTRTRKRHSGFTIVELLVVIVVIAILASISVNAYVGIQDRAQRLRIDTIVSSYVKAFKLYYAENGTLPTMVNHEVCLGSASDYPADGMWSEGQCMVYPYATASYPNGWWGIESNNLSDQLASVATGLPHGGIPEVVLSDPDGPYAYRGIYFELGSDYAYFEYVLRGNASCPSGWSRYYRPANNATQCNKSYNMR